MKVVEISDMMWEIYKAVEQVRENRPDYEKWPELEKEDKEELYNVLDEWDASEDVRERAVNALKELPNALLDDEDYIEGTKVLTRDAIAGASQKPVLLVLSERSVLNISERGDELEILELSLARFNERKKYFYQFDARSYISGKNRIEFLD